MGQVIDFLVIAICLYFGIRGLLFGFVSGIFSLIAYIVSYFAAIMFAPRFVTFLSKRINTSELLIQIVAYVAIFLFSYIVIKLIEVQLARFTNTSVLSGLNRLLGLLLGIMQGMIVVVFIDFLLRVQPVFDFSSFLDNSTLLKYLRAMFSLIHQYIKTVLP